MSSTQSTSTELDERLETRPSYEQLTTLIASIEAGLKSRSSESSALDLNVDPFQAARQYLFSTTLMFSITSGTLGVHETNVLYRYRDRLEGDPQELMTLFRTLLADDNSLIPGWYWLAWIGSEQLAHAMWNQAITDRDFRVRLNAWETLKQLRTPLPSSTEQKENILESIAAEKEVLIRRVAVEYLGAVAGEAEVKTLEKITTEDRDGLVRREASMSRLLVLARLRPKQIFDESLPDQSTELKRLLSEIGSNVREIETDTLLKLLKHSDEGLRLFAFRELVRKDELPGEMVSSLIKDPSPKVSDAVYRYLLNRHEEIDPSDVLLDVFDETYHERSEKSSFWEPPYANPNQIVLEILRGYSEEDLWKLIDWQSPLGALAYKGLALYYFPTAGPRIRSDLSDDFRHAADQHFPTALAKWTEFYSNSGFDLFGRSPSLFRGLFGSRESEENTPEASAKREVDDTKATYIAAALAGVAEHGIDKDLELGKRYLSHQDYAVRVEAVRIIERFGSDSDVNALIDLAKSSEGVLQERAALAALKRAADMKDAARQLIFSSKEPLVRIAISYLLTESEVARTAMFLEPLLLEKSDVIRKKTVAFFAKKYGKEELEQLLTKYTSNVTYYYDVVCWFDRILYAPAELKRLFVRQIESELDLQSS